MVSTLEQQVNQPLPSFVLDLLERGSKPKTPERTGGDEVAVNYEYLPGSGPRHEVRALDLPLRRGGDFKMTLAGYFNNGKSVGACFDNYDRNEPSGFYITLNPVKEELSARSNNKLTKARATTADTDILKRDWILIDIDPVRVSGIQSTDAESEAARSVADSIVNYLRSICYPEPVIVFSGNGYYVLFKVDLPNTDEVTELIRNFLRALGQMFNTKGATVDASTFNAARLIKAVGSHSRKGEHSPELGRPHRKSKFIAKPDFPEVVSRDLIELVAAKYDPNSGTASNRNRSNASDGGDGPAITPRTDKHTFNRARSYLKKMRRSVSGQGGHFALLEACCAMFRFGLDSETVSKLIGQDFNPECSPPWSEREIGHKIEDAYAKVIEAGEFGCLLNKGGSQPEGERKLLTDEIPNFEFGFDNELIPRPLGAIADDVMRIHPGTLFRIGSTMYGFSGGKVTPLPNTSALVSFIREPGTRVNFKNGSDLPTKDELFATLSRRLPEFNGISDYPHFPEPVKGIFYTCEPPADPEENGTLDGLLSFFEFGTIEDRQIAKSAIVSLFWNGTPPIPAFLITSVLGIGGVGLGKSTVVQVFSSLVGGAIEMGQKGDVEDIKTRMLSESAERKRVVSLDNFRQWHGAADLEALITARVISGRKLYKGEGTRENRFIYFLTMNGASLTRDTAQRFVTLKLGKPTHSATWRSDLDKFIEDNRERIYRDIAAFFQRPKAELSGFNRWGAWQGEILSRLENPEAVAELIRSREYENDSDRNKAKEFEEFVHGRLKELSGQNPFFAKVFIPSTAMAKLFGEFEGEEMSPKKSTQKLAIFESMGLLETISRSASNHSTRGFEYCSPGYLYSAIELKDLIGEDRFNEVFGKSH